MIYYYLSLNHYYYCLFVMLKLIFRRFPLHVNRDVFLNKIQELLQLKKIRILLQQTKKKLYKIGAKKFTDQKFSDF